MTAHKLPILSPVRLRAYPLVQRAVEESVAYGVRRAFKHTDAPDVESIIEAVDQSVMNAMCELFDFGDPE